MSDRSEKGPLAGGISRRNFLGAGSAAFAGAAALGASAYGQSRQTTEKGLKDRSFNNPGPENTVLSRLNPNSNTPPPTDHGTVQSIWYSFNLTHKRVQEGGWTNQVTQRELPSSTDIAGVRMRLTAGSYRELHWHTANEWAFMFYGNARVTVLNPDGTIFIGDVTQGDVWFFPSGFPHSIQGLGPDGCEFLLAFDEGMFSEESTFLLSDWVSHVPPEVLSKNFGLGESAISKLPTHPLYIFPGQVPPSLEQDIAAAGGKAAMSPINYTFKMDAMPPTKTTPGGEVRVVDSHNFPASKSIAAGLVRVKPGGMRELHWHPNANEWQFYISGKARMTVFAAQSDAHTMDFNEADVGFVPKSAGHYIENLGNTDLVFLEIFKTSEFQDVSLNNWLRHLPPELVTAHLNLDAADIRKIPAAKQEVLAG
jgi:oxalate decarboxylase